MFQPDRHDAIQAIESLIFESVPDITEIMQYNMPICELDEVVCAIASQKHYMSLYMDTSLAEKYGEELSALNVGKSCIRFKKLEQLPLETVKKILVETVKRQSQRDKSGL